MNINKAQVCANIKKLLASILTKQENKQWCDDDKKQLDKLLYDYYEHYKGLRYDDRAIKRMIWREFGIDFGNKNKPVVKPKEKA